jgi:hypothetical protein
MLPFLRPSYVVFKEWKTKFIKAVKNDWGKYKTTLHLCLSKLRLLSKLFIQKINDTINAFVVNMTGANTKVTKRMINSGKKEEFSKVRRWKVTDSSVNCSHTQLHLVTQSR